VEEVATRAGVNKTTVYRRYPTKLELVKEAIDHFIADMQMDFEETGSLRGDLINSGKAMIRLLSSAVGQGLFRTVLLDRIEPELESIFRAHQAKQESRWRTLGERAAARGELSSPSAVMAAVDAVAGAIHLRILFKKEHVDERAVADLVDTVLHGVLAGDSTAMARLPSSGSPGCRRS
jgi:AcrR family transcriptional regulator